VKNTWLRLQVLSAVERRLRQAALAFSAQEIRLDVEAETGNRLPDDSETEIVAILEAVPGIAPVGVGPARRWSKGHRGLPPLI
jgi:hypothetical protein